MKKEYYYKGNKLYNVRKVKGLNYNWHDLMANWKDKDEDNKEKLGKFYLKDLIIEYRKWNWHERLLNKIIK